MDLSDVYQHNLRYYAKRGEAVVLFFIYSNTDCESKSGGLLHDLVLEEIYKDGVSFIYSKDIVDFTYDRVVVFE